MTPTGDAGSVRLMRDDDRATILLDRPGRKNAIDEAAWRAFPKVAAEIATDPELAFVIVRGAGGTFSAGADISEFVALTAGDEVRRHAYADAVRDGEEALAAISIPTVAAIEGACIGGGCQIALACDLRIATESAWLGVTPARLGIVYPVESTRRLAAAVGGSAAKDLLFTGRLIPAGEALRIGLVDRVVPEGELDLALNALAGELRRTSRYSHMAAKRIVDGLDAPAPDRAALDALWRGGFAGEDLVEGARAFLDKRPPRFTWRRSPTND